MKTYTSNLAQLKGPDGSVITVQCITVTPEIATAFLATNTEKQRSLSRNNLETLKSAIERDEFLLNGETIVFDQKGMMINGQHRCHAVIDTGKSIVTLIVRGIPNKAFQTIDMGKARSSGDLLTIAGAKCGAQLSSVIGAVIQYEMGFLISDVYKPTKMEVANRYPKDAELFDEATRVALRHRFITPSVVGMLFFQAVKNGFRDEVIDFLQKTTTGLGLQVSDPAYLLRSRLLKDNSRIPRCEVCALAIKALNNTILKRPMQQLRVAKSEDINFVWVDRAMGVDRAVA